MHFRILKMIATSFLATLECNKFVFIALGELTALPRLPSWFKGPYTSKGRQKEGKK